MPRRIGGHVSPLASPSAHEKLREPCVACGEDTSVGSVFFSDRHVVELRDGASTFVCSLCDARMRSQHRGRRLTDDEVRQIVQDGTVIALGWRP